MIGQASPLTVSLVASFSWPFPVCGRVTNVGDPQAADKETTSRTDPPESCPQRLQISHGNVIYAVATTFALPPEIWSAIVDLLSFREASRGRLICKAFNKAVGKLNHLTYLSATACSRLS